MQQWRSARTPTGTHQRVLLKDKSPKVTKEQNSMSEITQSYKYGAIVAAAILAASTVVAVVGGAISG
jgi:hypothetical protein